MPSQARSRARYGGRDSDFEQEYSSRPLYRGDHYDDDDDDQEDYRPSRRYRRERPHRSRHESRGYESPVESPIDRRRERSKAKESPATSPIKKKDRQRDRDGHRRHRSYDQYGSPTREIRDRSQRERHDRRERHHDADTARRHRRRERDRGAAARKHQSSDSTNSGSHLLSADALAKLGLQHEEEDRLGRSRAADEGRREKKRKKRPLVDEHTRDSHVLPEEPPRISKGRVASGAYLEEGRSPGMEFRRRGGGPPMGGRWNKEGWDGSSEGADKPPIWKRKKWWIALGVLIVLLAIIIPVSVVFSKKHKGDNDDSDPADASSSPSNSNLDGVSHDSIPVSLLLIVARACADNIGIRQRHSSRSIHLVRHDGFQCYLHQRDGWGALYHGVEFHMG